MHLAISVYKSLCRICTCTLYRPVYSSLCFTCRRICSTAACAVPEGVWSIQPHVLHLDVRVSASICSTVVWVVLGGVWPTAAFANPIDVAVYCAAPVVHAFYAGPGRITKLLFYRKPFWLLCPLNEDINLKRLSLKWRGKTYITKVPTYRYSISLVPFSWITLSIPLPKQITKILLFYFSNISTDKPCHFLSLFYLLFIRLPESFHLVRTACCSTEHKQLP